MKAVLISINPPYTTMIFNGEKDIEWRRKSLPTGKYYVYETKKNYGSGKVIGEFEVIKSKKYRRGDTVPERYIKRGCVPIADLRKYAGEGEKAILTANFIANAKLYDVPKDLCDFMAYRKEYQIDKAYYQEGTFDVVKSVTTLKPISRAPQSWCYVDKVKFQ